MKRLNAEFFRQDPVTCARKLIGCEFKWHGCSGRIVETEAYAAKDDPACHTWFRPSTRDYVERHQAGDAYVYLNYGVHWMFNILVKSPFGDGFVLFRALEPLSGNEAMRERRGSVKDHILTAGPGRLTKAFGIDGSHHGVRFLNETTCAIHWGTADTVIAGPRVGISRAMDLPWRFGDPASASLSRKF
jgi:DNA-3-methyladenine glycosylase